MDKTKILYEILLILAVGFGFIAMLAAQNIIGERNAISASLNSPFSLKMDQAALLESENLKIKFLNVTDDSRCPSDVVCVWAGQVSVSFNIQKGGKNPGFFSMTSAGGQDTEISFEGYSIKLVRVEPYPKSSQQILPSDYAVVLAISKT